MSPEEHKAEAERLLNIGAKVSKKISDEIHGVPTNGLAALVRYADAQSVYAAAQVHATLALYRPPAQSAETDELMSLARRLEDAKRIFDGGGR